MKTKTHLSIITICLLSLTMNAQVPQYIPTNGLVGWWPFNGNANDESGNGYNGTNSGATLTTDRNGNANCAYSFNGSSNHIDVNDAAPLRFVGTSYSLSAWVDFYSFTEQDLIAKRASGVNNGWDLSTHLDMLAMPFTPAIFSNSLPGTNQWTNVVVTYNNSTQDLKFYFDGVLSSTVASVPSPNSTTNNMRFGADNTSLNYFHDGKLDDIGLWNRELTLQEIQDIYNSVTDTCFFTVYDTIHVTVYDTITVIDTTGGINFRDIASTVNVFPNPVRDKITIEISNFASLAGYQFSLINSLGEEIFRSEVDRKQFYVNLKSKTGNGLYYIQFYDSDKNLIEVKKIIVQ